MIWSGHPGKKTAANLDLVPFASFSVFRRSFRLHLPYISYLYRYVPPHRVEFLRRFGLKTGIHFAHSGMESGVVFEGTTKSV